jgi:hypothetical protein
MAEGMASNIAKSSKNKKTPDVAKEETASGAKGQVT